MTCDNDFTVIVFPYIHLMKSRNLNDIGSQPDSTKALLEPVLTYQQWIPLVCSWGQMRCLVNIVSVFYLDLSHNLNQCNFIFNWISGRIFSLLWMQCNESCTKFPMSLSFEKWLKWVNSLWPSDAIWRQRSGSTLAHVMVCCLTAPSHYLNQYCLIISEF